MSKAHDPATILKKGKPFIFFKKQFLTFTTLTIVGLICPLSFYTLPHISPPILVVVFVLSSVFLTLAMYHQ